MPGFEGFPANSRITPIPSSFFTDVLPQIEDLTELRVTLGLFSRLNLKKGPVRFVTLKELAGDLQLMSGLGRQGKDPSQQLNEGLRKTVGRGTFLHLGLERPDSTDHLYFLNTPAGRHAIELVQRGEVDLGAMPKIEAIAGPSEHKNIFGLYEENIGVLTPLIVEELKEAEEQYPYPWIVEAVRVAVEMNRRRWRYVQRILEHWKAEGRPSGRPARDFSQTTPAVSRPPEKRGGYIVKRQPPSS